MTDDQCQLARSAAVNTRRPPGRPDHKPVRTLTSIPEAWELAVKLARPKGASQAIPPGPLSGAFDRDSIGAYRRDGRVRATDHQRTVWSRCPITFRAGQQFRPRLGREGALRYLVSLGETK